LSNAARGLCADSPRATLDEIDQWLEADTAEALGLRRPLPDYALRIVAKGEKEDVPVERLPI
jgi:hypothetical protein